MDTSDTVASETVDTKQHGSGDTADAWGFSSPSTVVPQNLPPFDMPEEIAYKMDYPRRGRAIIINNKTFHPKTEMNERHGTNTDASNLYNQLNKLGFDVSRYDDLTRKSVQQVLNLAAKEDHSDADCFLLAMLSHGEEGVIYGTDGEMPLDDITAPFKGPKCKSLTGKPKIFFIQACRGTSLDSGIEVADAETAEEIIPENMGDEVDARTLQKIPVEADFLMCYSVVKGYFSWRNSSRGSWFIQCLCRALELFADKLEFVRLMTRVNRMVAYEFESNASQWHMNRKKQIPCISSMLTKDLYLQPKKLQ